MAERRAVEIDYPLAAVTAFAALIALPLGKRFRFLYLSGMIAERDQMKRLWYMQDARWLKVCDTIVLSPEPSSQHFICKEEGSGIREALGS